MIRALIVDDEPLVRERLRTLLAAHDDVQVVGERGDGPSALEAYRELSPQVVFLDIQMPGLSGLEVAETWKQVSKNNAVVNFINRSVFRKLCLRNNKGTK